ncbi:hypothetical protein BC567DRAFT_35959 [Phyllosticta citribraziliensis]
MTEYRQSNKHHQPHRHRHRTSPQSTPQALSGMRISEARLHGSRRRVEAMAYFFPPIPPPMEPTPLSCMQASTRTRTLAERSERRESGRRGHGRGQGRHRARIVCCYLYRCTFGEGVYMVMEATFLGLGWEGRGEREGRVLAASDLLGCVM